MAGESKGTIWQTLASWALHECICLKVRAMPLNFSLLLHLHFNAIAMNVAMNVMPQ
jgi:hypothetical protein